MILTLKTDNPVAQIGLYDDSGKQVRYHPWQADRKLAKDLLKEIKNQLEQQQLDWKDISGIIVFKGPGSFTGLRIGLTVANALSYSLDVPIIATQEDNWTETGLSRLKAGENDRLALPHYGAEAHITLPKK